MATSYACAAFAAPEDFFEWNECACQFDETDDDALIRSALDNASDILMLSSDGQVHGRCMVTVIPLGTDTCLPIGYRDEWGIANEAWDQFAGANTIPLRGPNTDIVEIIIDDVVVSPTTYRLVWIAGDRFLHRVNASWPTGNIDDEGQFSITYRFGRDPDLLTKIATLELACELASFYTTGTSRLPPGVTSANIQGASVALRDEEDQVRQYLAHVGSFLSVYGPKEMHGTGGVWSPELDHGWTLVQVGGPSGS